ncbi:tetratricopeptide repeat-containing response regulator [Aquipseudomonas guryensis]|uniref:Response regulator n=1 Tax=Aquipseudomonas guryensis TaxID=2759165 RepID=A0A7W4D9L0_9GAMM|nr:tetratricopeptide repeat-containing response regulator [Pseudomonas guryensis]MBB1518505.1 response regulator [Pseudomonas guryensis]
MADYSNTRFLIVDDFSDFRSSVKAMLRDIGARDVDTADRGEEALALCRQKRYDIILHDYNLGTGKNGQQVLEELIAGKLISHQCIFVMVTAESSQAMVLSALEHEPDAYLTKPFNRASLAQRLDKLVERKTLLKPVLQALDKQEPAAVLAACDSLSRQDKRLVPLCQRYQAGALRELNRHAELEKLLTGVLADRALPWAYIALGSLLQTRNELARAQELYEQALQTFPMLPALYDGLAAVLAARGESKRAQEILEDAVKLSPLAIRRQMQLGKLALDNEDFGSASKAYRQAMEQGRNSRFKSPESYLGMAQALIAESGEENLDKRAQADIAQAMGELDKHYGEDKALQVRATLMQAKSLQKSGDPARAAKLTEEAVARMADLPQFFSADAALLVASQLRELGQAAASETLLKSCVEIYGDDPTVMQNVAKQTDDPQILAGGQEAVDFNRQGIRVYQLGRFADALELFRRGLALQPKNISIALNTAQSLLRLGGDKPEPDLLDECRRCLDAVSMIPSSDPRYERYQQLRRRAFEQ